MQYLESIDDPAPDRPVEDEEIDALLRFMRICPF
jgi:hypothetical protein